MVLVFALVAWTLAVGVFPDQDPGLSRGAYWAMGVIAALLFFGSVLLHELGHALQARRDDVRIEGITLWLFGGVAQFRGMYGSPGAEFRIAIAGPIVTAVIAGALLAIGAIVALPESVDGVVYWLGYINLSVLVFNLLPALPLDGGRLLHAALWRYRRDLRWATRVGAGIGVAFGYLMIGGGLALWLTRTGFGGLWLAVIGWFLTTAARAEARQIEAREALHGRHVAELMTPRPVSVAPDMTLGAFIDQVAQRARHTAYPVVEEHHPVGLLTFRCVAQVPREHWDEHVVRECMLPRDSVPRVAPGDDGADALSTLSTSEPRRALVVEDDDLVGLLSLGDLLHAAQIGPRDGGQQRSSDGWQAREPAS